jgi:ABC-type multidrug transport system fused ATPase/permease subunit
LWEPSSGIVLFDGVDIRAIPVSYLRSHIAWVPQNGGILSGSIRENLELGREGGVTEADLTLALTQAKVDFLNKLPDGLDTTLGEGGQELSCGQAQRIALARALLRKPRLLILDEPTSQVDPESERAMMEGLAEVRDGLTVLVVAHRLWSVRQADKILVLDDGRITEAGTHDELLRARGLYHQLWMSLGQESHKAQGSLRPVPEDAVKAH